MHIYPYGYVYIYIIMQYTITLLSCYKTSFLHSNTNDDSERKKLLSNTNFLPLRGMFDSNIFHKKVIASQVKISTKMLEIRKETANFQKNILLVDSLRNFKHLNNTSMYSF